MENLATRLEGELVVLEPLEEAHAEGLWAAAQAPEIWQWLAHVGSSREYFDRWMEISLAAQREGQRGRLRDRAAAADDASSAAAATSTCGPPTGSSRSAGPGSTPRAWRSGINVEAKLLMLGHAFEPLGCVRVELKTDARNERSRAAMAALPGPVRGHPAQAHDRPRRRRQRDSAYFSVIDEEWPGGPRQPRTPPRSSRGYRRQLAAIVIRSPVGDLFGPLAHFFGRLAGRRDRLVAGGGDALARLAADDVAEGVLEALGAAVGREALFGLGLLLRPCARRSGAAPRPSRGLPIRQAP